MALDFILGLLGLGDMGIASLVENAQCEYNRQKIASDRAYRISIGIPEFGFYPSMIRPIFPEDRPDNPEVKDGKHFGYYDQGKWYPGYDFTVETSLNVDQKQAMFEAIRRHRNLASTPNLFYKGL